MCSSRVGSTLAYLGEANVEMLVKAEHTLAYFVYSKVTLRKVL